MTETARDIGKAPRPASYDDIHDLVALVRRKHPDVPPDIGEQLFVCHATLSDVRKVLFDQMAEHPPKGTRPILRVIEAGKMQEFGK